MMKRIAAGLLALLLMGGTMVAQDVPSGPGAPATGLAAPAASANKVDGLELPADQVVAADEGFVNIAAKCKGQVKWLVISNVKVKYITNDATNSIIVSVPPTPGTLVTVFAVGQVDNKMTEFVRTAVQVGGVAPGPGPNPPGPNPPGPNPPAPVVNGKFHLTFVVDMNNATPDLAALLNSAALRKTVSDKGGFMRIYDKTSPVVAQKKLDGLVTKNGGNATMILQTADGAVVNSDALAVPTKDTDVIATINKYVR